MPKTDITVGELVNKVRRGELVLPEMQRRYVWPATRVRDLLDSLYRGYPSGTILVWETNEDLDFRELAVRPTNAPTVTTRLLLLDGQQRVTSLAAILSGEAVSVRGRKRPINILFNLEHPDGPPVETTEIFDETVQDIEDADDEEDSERDLQAELNQRTFVVESKSLLSNPVWVRVSDIFAKSETETLRAIGINSEDPRWDKYASRLQKVRKIADYPYVMQTLDMRMSYEEVTEIFVRVNSLGMKLRGSDLALAQITSRWKGFMKALETAAEEFGDDGDYLFERGLFVRLLVIFATHQSRFKTVGKIGLPAMEQSWKSALDGLRYAVNFLRGNAGIENLEHLSSPFLLVPIAVYSVLKQESISEKEEKNLLYWFYAAHMRGHYSMGSSETILDQDLSSLFKKASLDDLITTLQLHVKKIVVDVDDIAFKGSRSPFFSMLYFVLKQNGAKDWFSNLKISESHLGRSHQLQFHHTFPKALLQKAGYEKREINEIANLAFIGGKTNRQITDKAPAWYFEHEVVPKSGEAALASQLIPLDRHLWEIERYRDYLAARRQAIADAINGFMKRFE